MTNDLAALFKKYEVLVNQLDAVFEGVQKKHPECVNCDLGCSDCCHALFDLYMIEAIYINRRFLETVAVDRKNEILSEANRLDRQIYQLKRKAFKALEAGEKTNEQVLIEMASERIRCPLLNSEDRCEIYAYRPITCRLYGIPTAIDGRGHTCGLSGFKEGKAYPTVNLDSINQRLHGLSCEMVGALRSRHQKMGDVLMPLSMALLTHFDEAYLGIKTSQTDPESCPE
jgi:Fe-S-cluster containining protein